MRLKRDNFQMLLVTLLSFFLTACSQGGSGNEYAEAGSSPSPQTSAAQKASSDSNMGMSNMNMPAKSTKDPKGKPPEAASANQVVIENFSFAPATLTVSVGTTVTWINRDDIPHTVYDTDKRFKSSAMDTDDKFSFTFKSAGSYNYFCSLHPRMTGQIIVK